MIKCDFCEFSATGNSIILQAEFTLICKQVKEMFVEDFGEKRGIEMFEHCIELSTVPEEEIDRRNKAMVEDNPLIGVMADAFIKLVWGGESSPSSVEEEDKDE